jgi:hypothetical protein
VFVATTPLSAAFVKSGFLAREVILLELKAALMAILPVVKSTILPLEFDKYLLVLYAYCVLVSVFVKTVV